ncbi:hypothetical protein HanXRQr2_Chr16g0750751 [Helianthus annuus]|uniref:Uncharacterized protein n=1 Tax=Helianthus annuus TaxID=4232 RepID=A0A251RZC3_HELAN|nr:hypothetical protein HanXRQr2_Chr16g0750751 [Helianthus annuus]KAJ0438292.1 hypothetical protein HanHA300_Chr16g0612301 [Helianthus annuus]KAJ0460617.1 hypothetical protein HanHA89_Chr16g0662891 [Helianthus annuus]
MRKELWLIFANFTKCKYSEGCFYRKNEVISPDLGTQNKGFGSGIVSTNSFKNFISKRITFRRNGSSKEGLKFTPTNTLVTCYIWYFYENFIYIVFFCIVEMLLFAF